jgi:predicted XRE-type DNA-binding protein
MPKHIDYEVGSGNVFADIGVSQPEEANAKAELALQINRLIEQRALTQTEAAKVLGINQPKMSALMRGQLSGFSIERLIRFLGALGRDVQIVVTPSSPVAERGRLTVHAPL